MKKKKKKNRKIKKGVGECTETWSQALYKTASDLCFSDVSKHLPLPQKNCLPIWDPILPHRPLHDEMEYFLVAKHTIS